MRVINLSSLDTFTAVNLSSDPGAIGGPVVVPQCAQIVLNWVQDDGKFAHNVLFGRYSGAFSGSVAQANAILTALAGSSQFTALRAHMAPSTSLSGVSIRDVNTANQAIISSSSAGAPGSSTGSALPCETAAVITLRTALTGRANRGRIYVPNWATTALAANNVIAAAVVSLLAAWAQTIPGALSPSGYTLVIGQKARAQYTGSTGTLHPARAATSVAVTSLEVRDNHWDSQRRRGLK